MSKTKNNSSVAVVKTPEGEVVGYLSARDEEKGLDIDLDMQGYVIESL